MKNNIITVRFVTGMSIFIVNISFGKRVYPIIRVEKISKKKVINNSEFSILDVKKGNKLKRYQG